MANNTLEASIINKYGKLIPSTILRYFIESPVFQVEHEKRPYTFIILGRSGPTGKSWLRRGFVNYGFNAFEPSESVIGLVDYWDNENHVIESGYDRSIIIVLNKSLKEDV